MATDGTNAAGLDQQRAVLERGGADRQQVAGAVEL
jgi:hypothetical protein